MKERGIDPFTMSITKLLSYRFILCTLMHWLTLNLHVAINTTSLIFRLVRTLVTYYCPVTNKNCYLSKCTWYFDVRLLINVFWRNIHSSIAVVFIQTLGNLIDAKYLITYPFIWQELNMAPVYTAHQWVFTSAHSIFDELSSTGVAERAERTERLFASQQ